MRELIEQLSDMRGISGFEYRITDKLMEMLRQYCDDVRLDPLGSVIGIRRCGKENAPRIMVEAHCDEIGLMVTSVTDEGYLTFTSVGGIDQRTLPSGEVTVHGQRDLWGVVGIKPEYMLEDGKTVKLSDMVIDTGLGREEVRRLVSVGDGVSLPQTDFELANGQYSGKSLDDRAGVAAILRALSDISGDRINADVYAVFAVQEEVGCRGGKTSAYGIDPDLAIAIDVTHGITPDNMENAFAAGEGITISVGPNIHPKLSERLFDTALRHGIKVSEEVDGGDTGTDAWEIQTACDGIPTALISIPLKYMHTSVETLALSDVQALARLLAEFIKEQEDLKWLSF